MTDRYSSYTVVLTRDVRSDDAESITNAILMIKGVMSVVPNVADISLHTAQIRVKTELAMACNEAIMKILEK